MDDISKLVRVPGRLCSSEHSLVFLERGFIPDVKGYYKILNLDPNRQYPEYQDIKSNFRRLVKLANNDRLDHLVERLIESWVVLSDQDKRYNYDRQQVDWDQVDLSSVVIEESIEEDLGEYSYYTEVGEVQRETVELWLQFLSLSYFHLGVRTDVRLGFVEGSWRIQKQGFGEVIMVPKNLYPDQELSNYFVSRTKGEEWYKNFCKIQYEPWKSILI